VLVGGGGGGQHLSRIPITLRRKFWSKRAVLKLVGSGKTGKELACDRMLEIGGDSLSENFGPEGKNCKGLI